MKASITGTDAINLKRLRDLTLVTCHENQLIERKYSDQDMD